MAMSPYKLFVYLWSASRDTGQPPGNDEPVGLLSYHAPGASATSRTG